MGGGGGRGSSGAAYLDPEDEVGYEDPGQGHQETPAHYTVFGD